MCQLPGIVNTTLAVATVVSATQAKLARDRAIADAIDQRTFATVADTHRRLDRIQRILALMDALDALDDDD